MFRDYGNHAAQQVAEAVSDASFLVPLKILHFEMRLGALRLT
jgi:hypothetical protein